jgi:hypothetical protein
MGRSCLHPPRHGDMHDVAIDSSWQHSQAMRAAVCTLTLMEALLG